MKNVITLFFILLSFFVIASNKYVAKTGSDSNDGSLATPYLTITKGITGRSPGDTVFVKSGTYNEYVRFYISGSEGNPVVLKNYNNDVVTIDSQNTRYWCIYAINQDYITIDGINCINSVAYNIFFDNCSNIKLKNLTSDLSSVSSTIEGILFDTLDTLTREFNIEIINCKAYRSSQGISVQNNIENVLIQDCESAYNSFDGFLIKGLDGGVTMVRNIEIIDCYSHDNGKQGIGTTSVDTVLVHGGIMQHNGATGIQFERYSHNATAEYVELIHNSDLTIYETGIWAHKSNNVTMRYLKSDGNKTGVRITECINANAYYNLIINNMNPGSGTGARSGGVDISSSSGTFYNNVLYNNCTSTSVDGSVRFESGTCDFIFRNNIIAEDNSPYDIVANVNVTSSDYNIIYNSKRALAVRYNNTTTLTFEQYKTQSGNESNTINVDPLFVDAANNAFILQSLSPAIDAGVNVGLTTDYQGNAVSGIPDIGAYEYIQEVIDLGTKKAVIKNGKPYVKNGKIILF